MATELNFYIVLAGTALLIGTFSFLVWVLVETGQSTRRQMKQLAHAVRERAKSEQDLREANRKLVSAALTGGMAYYLNSSLFTIKEFAEYLKSVIGLEPGHVANEILGRLSNGLQMAIKVSDRLYQLSHPTELVFKQVAVISIQNITDSKAASFSSQSIKHLTNFEVEPQSVYGNKELLEQALESIITNAVEAMPDGGVLSISFKEVPGEKVQGLAGDALANHYLAIEITDTGSGMDSESRSKAFEPFYTTKKGFERLGLGLSLAYGIVSLHEGHIDLKSSAGKGTSVTVYLPLGLRNLAPKYSQDEALHFRDIQESRPDPIEGFMNPGVTGDA